MNVLPTVYFMLVFSLLSLGLSQRIEERARSLVPDRVQNSIIQLALAQHRYISDPDNDYAGKYADDIDRLETSGYLPIWEDDTAFSFTNTTPPGFTIRYIASSTAEAGRIALRLGAIARVSDNEVTVGFADPTDLTLLDEFITQDDAEGEFVRRAGDKMTGPLSFDTGLGDAIDLNQNSLTDVLRLAASEITAKKPDGSGKVKADIILGTTATFNDILIEP